MRVRNSDITPELRMLGRLVRTVHPSFSEASFFPMARAMRLLAPLAPHPGLQKSQVWIDGEGSTCSSNLASDAAGKTLRLCLYRPATWNPAPGRAFAEGAARNAPRRSGSVGTHPPASRPGMLWIHGGGFAIGAPEQDELPFIGHFVNDLGCIVVSPDYTLSTQAPFPAALEDCYATLAWMVANADALGIDSGRIVVGGNSAGGNLAAATCLLARDLGWPRIRCQLLAYPMLDERTCTPSALDNDGPVWNAVSNRAAWRLYLSGLSASTYAPPYAAPAHLKRIEGLPPLIAYVGSIDPFRDETIAYANALASAGVPASLAVFDGCFHGFDILAPRTTPAKAARRFVDQHLQPYLLL